MTTGAGPGILLVDDDSISANLLMATLAEHFRVEHVSSGDACLAAAAVARPDVVLMDIEMPGLNGYETCRRLRERDASPQRPGILFISVHDNLQERLQAYAAGGDDFIAKPAEPSEVLSKVQVLLQLAAERRQLSADKDALQRMAMGFLTNLGESGTLVQFLRAGPSCASLGDLANLTLASLAEYGLEATVQIRGRHEVITTTINGHASPLEQSVLDHVRELDRIFQFRQRLVVNFPNATLLVSNMPLADAERCGRLRDYLAIVAEGIESCIVALNRTAEVDRQRRALEQSQAAIHEALESLRAQYRRQQTETQVILLQLLERFAKELIHIGLSESQESTLQNLMSDAVQEALGLFQGGLDFDRQLDRLIGD